MKFFKTAFLALLVSTAFIACDKDNDLKPSVFSVEGVWKGTTGNGGFFGLNIKPGGSLERISSTGEVSATGNWQLTDNTLSGNYHYIASGTDVTFTATIDKAKNELSGTWSNNGGEQGTMSATKH